MCGGIASLLVLLAISGRGEGRKRLHGKHTEKMEKGQKEEKSLFIPSLSCPGHFGFVARGFFWGVCDQICFQLSLNGSQEGKGF